jgi:CopG antitoxin of type II toxin-antitoxin system
LGRLELSKRQKAAQRARRIPDFATKEEEAAWWDSHSITDYLDELEPVQVRFAKNLSDPIAVRLDPGDRAELSRQAKELGIGPSTLIRMLVRERLKQGA